MFVRVQPAGIGDQAEANLQIQWKDAGGKWLTAAGNRMDRLPAGTGQDWSRLAVFVKVPAGARGLVFIQATPQDSKRLPNRGLLSKLSGAGIAFK